MEKFKELDELLGTDLTKTGILNIKGALISQIFQNKHFRDTPDYQKQELFDDILKAKRAIYLLSDENDQQQTEKEPDLAYEPIKENGSFSMLFDKKLAGLDFIKDIDISIKAKG